MPEIQDYIEHIIQKHEKLPTNPPNPQIPEDIKLFGSKKKKINGKSKEWGKCTKSCSG